jgi:hypothetical protein
VRLQDVATLRNFNGQEDKYRENLNSITAKTAQKPNFLLYKAQNWFKN